MESQRRNGTNSLTNKTIVIANHRQRLAIRVEYFDELLVRAGCNERRVIVNLKI
jgi:hypothetical protein